MLILSLVWLKILLLKSVVPLSLLYLLCSWLPLVPWQNLIRMVKQHSPAPYASLVQTTTNTNYFSPIFGTLMAQWRVEAAAAEESETTEYWNSPQLWLKLGFELFLLAECIFYLAYWRQLSRLQKHYPHHPDSYHMNRSQRWALFRQCVIHSQLDEIPQFLSGWFFGAPFESIYRDNVMDFLAWAFFMEDYDEIRKVGNREKLDDLDMMLQSIEQRFKFKFTEGRNLKVRCMRLSLDRMEPRHKPLFYYVVLYILSTIFEVFFTRWMGFVRYQSRAAQQTLLAAWYPTHRHPPEKIPYWFRPASAGCSIEDSRLPIVFIHGIGVGVFAYLNYLLKLCRQTKRPIFMIELPHVSSKFFPLQRYEIESVPTMMEMCRFLDRIFERHGMLPDLEAREIGSDCSSVDNDAGVQARRPIIRPFATIIGHSLGSTVLAWIIRYRAHYVRKAIFLDPVCFLLHLPDVAYNFVYRKPTSWVEMLLRFFASGELYVSWTLNRCFYWFQNILFAHEIPSWCHTSIFIGGSDSIVPGEKVRKYLLSSRKDAVEFLPEQMGDSDRKQSNVVAPESTFNVYYYPRMNHAQFLFDPKIEDLIADCSAAAVESQTVTLDLNLNKDEGYDTSDVHHYQGAAEYIASPLKMRLQSLARKSQSDGMICN